MTTKKNTTLLLLLFVSLCHCKILEIVKVGHPTLRSISEEFSKEEILSEETQTLVEDMIETMNSAKGVGLAGPQIDVKKRIFVAGVNNSEVDPPLPAMAFINPSLDFSLGYGKPKVNIFEGCLSLPGYRALVPRYDTVVVTFNDETGLAKRIKATDIAGVIQHEYDHLNGVIYIDKMDGTTFCNDEMCDAYFSSVVYKKGTWEYF